MENLRSSAWLVLFATASYVAACSSDAGTDPINYSPTAGTTASSAGSLPVAGSSVQAGAGGTASVAGASSGGVAGTAGGGAPSAGMGGSVSIAGTATGGGGAAAGGGGATTGGGGATAGGAGAGGTGTAGTGGSGGTGPITPANEVWVAPNGSDTNPGTEALPMKTVCDTSTKTGACYKLCKGSYTCPATGGTIWMKDGTYAITKKIDFGATRPGVAGGIMKLWAAPGAKPIIDAAGLDTSDITKTGIAIHVKASYWHIRGIEVKNAPHNCIKVEGGYNTVENVVVHHCGNTGITIGQYDGTDMSASPGANNTISNCDSYGNVGPDGRGEDADGFGAKEAAGKNNVFKGCRAWNNADDGYDFYGWADPISVQNCWSFENAKMNAPGGDGNGFKLGKGAGGHTLSGTISAYNVKTGYTSNGADKLSTCTNCKACSNGSVTGSGDHGMSGTISNLSPCPDLKKAEGARNPDASLPGL